MNSLLPQTPQDFLTVTWDQFEPIARQLLGQPLKDNALSSWLTDWSDLSRAISETFQRRYVASTVNTADPVALQQYQAYVNEIQPVWMSAEQKFKQKLLTGGFVLPGLEIPLRNMHSEADLFREANLPLLSEELKLCSEYDQIIGAQTVDWDGGEVTLPQLLPVNQEHDRHRRELAWRLSTQRRLADRQALNELWSRMMSLRVQIAANAGMPDYRAYRWQQMLRFDYTPQDCTQFQKAIEEVVVPAASRLYQKRRQKLGLDTLRPWDLEVDLLGQEPLKPYRRTEELVGKIEAIYSKVDPQLGEYFAILRREGLLDLDNRKDKAPGAYCTNYDASRLPFIFMNAVGLHSDVMTLLHEGGHAFHVFEVAHLPYHCQLKVGLEFAEVASTSMELLCAPLLDREEFGFYSSQQAARARLAHLEQIVTFLPYMAVVDSFQHWAYEDPSAAMFPENCDAVWADLWNRFMVGVDWSGLEDVLNTGWHRKEHIFQVPFYYVEYGMAILGAVQVWRNALENQPRAVADYRQALALGGTVSIPQLFAAAGIKFAYDADFLRMAIGLIEGTMSDLEAKLA